MARHGQLACRGGKIGGVVGWTCFRRCLPLDWLRRLRELSALVRVTGRAGEVSGEVDDWSGEVFSGLWCRSSLRRLTLLVTLTSVCLIE